MNSTDIGDIKIPVSIGEVFDKYSILEIKLSKINNQNKKVLVSKESELLKPYLDKYPLDIAIYNNLKKVNTELWDIEDELRVKEFKKDFGEEFIQLARKVYLTNDKRAEIKRHINMLFKSEIIEIKDYIDMNTGKR
tara:strand:+ start:44 stop:451 length:408 start_codon:yes stop_codon:yes gene_type:complete